MAWSNFFFPGSKQPKKRNRVLILLLWESRPGDAVVTRMETVRVRTVTKMETMRDRTVTRMETVRVRAVTRMKTLMRAKYKYVGLLHTLAFFRPCPDAFDRLTGKRLGAKLRSRQSRELLRVRY